MIKRKKSRGVQEINAGSMADIAFLLLIFFLVTTTMDTDVGILRLLPPVAPDEEVTDIVKQKNIYMVLINDADMLLVEDEQMNIENLRAGAVEFLTNPNKSDDLPELTWVRKGDVVQKVGEYKKGVQSATDPTARSRFEDALKKWEGKLEAIEMVGEYQELPGAAVISLQTGSKTSYDMYLQVQNELQAAVRELRDDLSLSKFGVKYGELDDKTEDGQRKIKAIRQVYPQRISEAEPVVRNQS